MQLDDEEESPDDGYYNILALDSAGKSGLITAKVLTMIEEYAKTYTEQQGLTTPIYDVGTESVPK